jgi:hypothetical protein
MSISSQDICEAAKNTGRKSHFTSDPGSCGNTAGEITSLPSPATARVYVDLLEGHIHSMGESLLFVDFRETHPQFRSSKPSNPRRQEPSPVGASGPRLNRTGAPKRLGVGWDDLLLGLNIG